MKEERFEQKEVEKITFTVKYSDGTKKEVEEGVMFEFIGQAINVYIGTHRAAAVKAIQGALNTTLKQLGLEDKEIKANV